MSQNLNGFVFDLDGTLLDTLDDIAAACNHALDKLGQPTHPAQAYKRMVGDGADVLVRRALPADQQPLADEALRLFNAYYTHHATDMTRLYPGVAELLDALSSREMPLAILTNKPQAATEVVVGELLSHWEWVAVFGHRPNVPKKPDPAAALEVAALMGLSPIEVGFVGDSSTDMLTAGNAGMTGIGAAWGFRGEEELRQHGAGMILHHPLDLMPHL